MVGTTLNGRGSLRATARRPWRVGVLLACAVPSATQPAAAQANRDCAATAETETVFTLGLDGDDLLFQLIKSISISEDGKIVVLDVVSDSDPAVTVVSPSGDVMARWGRAGDGPGGLEDAQLRAVFVGSDTVAVAGYGRAAAYTWRGEELVRYQLAATHVPESLGAGNLGGLVRAIAFVAGRIVTWKLGFDYAKLGELAAAGGGDIDEMFSAVSSSMRYKFGPWDESETWTTRAAPPALDISLSARFFPQPVLAAIPGRRVVVGFGDEYVLHVLSGESGDTIGRIARDVPVRYPTPAFVRSAAFRDGEEELESFGLIKDAFWGPPGVLWVERDLGVDDGFSGPLEHWKECRSWDLFDVDGGTFLGAVSLPEGFSPMAGNDSLLAGVVVDELEQAGLRVLRVSVPGAGEREPK